MAQSGVLAVNKKDINDYPIDVPNFNKNMSIVELESFIPINYSHIVSASFNEDTDTFDLYFSQAEEGNENVKIPARIFMPSERKNIFPNFVLEVSTHLGVEFDYGNNPGYILNQNQFLYLVILHRLMMYDGQNTHYTHLLRSDISALANYGEYDSYSSYNAKKKSENYITVISPWVSEKSKDVNGEEQIDLLMKHPLGDYISNESKKTRITDKLLNAIFRDLPIQPASESMASEGVKFVVYPHDKELYKCAGYTSFNAEYRGIKYSAIKTVFPRKPNLPSRFKSHIISDCYNFKDSDSPIFYEDIHNLGTGEVDNTIKNAFIVFDEMNDSTGRLICGEIEASKSFSDNIIYTDEVVRERFKDIKVSVGEKVIRTGNKFVLGIDEEDEIIALYNFDTVEIVSIEDTGYGSSYKIIARCSKPIGSSKALSTTGIKGMTKPKPRLGSVIVLDSNKKEILDENGEPFVFEADMVLGMNSVKAKSNTIFLARAALSSFICISDNPLLHSMDADEINKEANRIGQCLWIDQFGTEKLVWFGVVQIKVNELSCTYNNVKLQKFMAESGRYLRDGGYRDVFEKIWDIGIDPEMKEAVLELQKILVDDKAYYSTPDDIPYFTPDDLLYGYGPDNIKMFEIEDCQFDMQPTFPYTSKMLDEEWNAGWYLDLRSLNINLGLTRMPSAKLLNLLTRELPDGRISYPVIFKMVSSIVSICLTINTDGDYKGKRNLAFLVDIKNGDRTHNSTQKHIARYLSVIHGMIYKKKDLVMSHSKMIDVFMKPQLPGVGMKQMAEAYVPQGTGVIIDDRAYRKLSERSGGFYDKHGYFNSFCIRNPAIWKDQIQSFKIMNKASFEMYLLCNHGLALEDILVTKYDREVLLMNPEDILIQQADCDGDLMPVFLIDHYPSQVEIEKIRTFYFKNSSCGGLDGILQEEIKWHNDYRQDELSANEDLNLDGKRYELYEIPFHKNPVDTQPTFLQFFRDSIIAKGEVGSATIQLWAINTLLEIYKDMCDKSELKDHKGNVVVISKLSCQYIVYTYTNLIQTFVVRGIKHVEGGSNGFEPFKLENISKKISISTRNHLLNIIKMPRDVLKDFEMMLHWMKDKKYLESVTKYIAMFNSGKVITNVNPEHIKRIENGSFYGYLLKDLRNVEEQMHYEFAEEMSDVKPVNIPDKAPSITRSLQGNTVKSSRPSLQG